MFSRIIYFSIHHKLLVAVFTLVIIGLGIANLKQLPLDAVPDITDNQVQVITSSPDLSAQEVERLITYPLELEMGNIPMVENIRSISRFGLSVITIVFEEKADIYWAREQINQKIQKARTFIPEQYGNPEMGPLSTGLGEIYQYVIYPASGYEEQYDATDLRTIQDWMIKRQLTGIKGVVEVNSSGGFLKQYEIALDQTRMKAFGISLDQIFEAVSSSNANAGGSYIEKENYTYFIRGEGMAIQMEDLENIVVKNDGIAPVLLKQIATLQFGHAPRFGAVTMNGKGEVVAGQVMMLKGENSMEVTRRVKERIELIKQNLPEGIQIEPYLDRSKLVNQTTYTVVKNLSEGALIVIFILVLLLGNFRAGLIVASVIPISMLFAISCMKFFDVSANLMSLGAIDFGLIVDGAVIVVEAILHHLGIRNKSGLLSREEKTHEIYHAASSIRTSAMFGEIIILIVYLPIFFLRGVEGKMFIPMAQTVSFAILGALILSTTYVPMMADLLLKNAKTHEQGLSTRIMAFIYRMYAPVRDLAFRLKFLVIFFAFFLLVISLWVLSRMGSEFIPTLEEGDLALHQILPTGSSIKKGVEVSAHLQDILMDNFPEVEKVVTKIGTAEIPTDIMPLEAGDIYVILKPKKEWTSATDREELFDHMEEELGKFPGVVYEFTQPIQMRFNELMTGIRQDIAIKIYGEDLGILSERATIAAGLLQTMEGIGDIKVEATTGLQQMVVDYDLKKMATYGLTTAHLNDLIKSSFAGKIAGYFYEGERRFDVVIRLQTGERTGLESLENLQVNLPGGSFISLKEVAEIEFREGPSQISRDDTRRRITIGVNARNIDIATLVENIRERLATGLSLPPGYFIRYGGQFENLERAQRTLSLVVPLVLFLIFLLLYLTFQSFRYAMLIFAAIPLATIGGIWALYIRGMPFSISAGVGFIALFGVAVLNGIVLIGYFNQLKKQGMTDILKIVETGTRTRLRPVVMTAAVASLGFLPMALSKSSGAEVQQPLATVVIGGLITATFLTMIILPVLYFLLETKMVKVKSGILSSFLILFVSPLLAQNPLNYEDFLVKYQEVEKSQERAGEWSLSALEVRKKNPLAPNQTIFSLSTEEYQFEPASGIQSLNIRQDFRLKKPSDIYRHLYETQGDLVRGQVQVQVNQNKQKIMTVFIEASYLTALLETEIQLNRNLSEYFQASIRRVELGESSVLISQQINQMRTQSETELQRIRGQLSLLIHNLQFWTGLQNMEITSLRDMDLQPETQESVSGIIHPNLLLLQTEQEQLRRQRDVLLTQNYPSMFSNFRLQRLNGQFLFFGLEVGVGFPLDNSFRKNQSDAYEGEIRARQEQVNFVEKWLKSEKQRLLQEALLTRQTAERYHDQISEQSKLIAGLYRAFQAGEVTQSDLILAFQNLAQAQRAELENLKIYFLKLNEIRHYVLP